MSRKTSLISRVMKSVIGDRPQVTGVYNPQTRTIEFTTIDNGSVHTESIKMPDPVQTGNPSAWAELTKLLGTYDPDEFAALKAEFIDKKSPEEIREIRENSVLKKWGLLK